MSTASFTRTAHVKLTETATEIGSLGFATLGKRVVAVVYGGLVALEEYLPRLACLGELRHAPAPDAEAQLHRVLSGAAPQVEVDFALVKSEFERAVYNELLSTKPGTTVTYGELARRVGHPGAARAVGAAMRKNPLPFLVPCHRVLPQAGGLGQYSGGGPAVKQLLLSRESA